MATITKESVTSLNVTLVNGDTVSIEENAVRAYNDFLNGRTVEDDEQHFYPVSAILSVSPIWGEDEIDMTDNSCVESASGDVVFRFELSKGSYVNVTKDMLECQDTGGGYMGGFFIPNAQLPAGESYDASVGGQIYRLSVETHDGSSYMGNELFMFTDVSGGIGGQALLTGGGTFSSCEEMETYTLNLFTGAHFDIVGDDPK